ncbi:MAG: cation:proton antiporter domain-containing protein [Planctomycetota bacterium]|jgi:mannitol/fructose-specific phosphotransferase system IIA component (Ntr-type)
MILDPDPLLRNASELLVLAIVLVAGVTGGALVKRFHLPSVTGQILVGIVLGHSLLGVGLFSEKTVESLQPLTHFALGLIAVTVGNHLNIRRLRNAGKRLVLLLVMESILTPAIILPCVLLTGQSWGMGVLLAAMAVSTAPATIVAIVAETRSKGVFVKTLVAAVALNNISCILLFELAHTALRLFEPGVQLPTGDILLAPLIQLGLSLLLGGGAGALLVIATRRMVLPDRLATASMIAILLTSGVADYLHVSPLLSCLFLGVALANLTPEKEEVGHAVFADFEYAILAVFFTVAGMELHFENLGTVGVLAALLVAARLMGKFLSALFAMRLAGATRGVRNYLGWALIPQAGVAVGLMLLVREDQVLSQSFRDVFLAVGLTTVTFNEIIGPIFVRGALKRSGDFGKDRARLIDFLHEENIVTGLRAATKEEAIGKLTDLLIRSNNLKKVNREKLLRTILDREREVSTCIGNGLAIPHGVLEEGDSIYGVMGLSREGLPFETPDGAPVHCIVLLATPPHMRDRHLEILAALTRAIASDRNIRRQLFGADTAAHAYEILHAEEAVDFNYFLEDERR